MEKSLCPAYAILRPSAERLLMSLEAQVAHNGGQQTKVWNCPGDDRFRR
jgi:hypothetical protein